MAGFFGIFKRDPRIDKYLEESEHHVDMTALRSFLRRRMEEIQRQKEEEERDLIFQSFFQHSRFNILEVNEALYDQNLPVLGRVY